MKYFKLLAVLAVSMLSFGTAAAGVPDKVMPGESTVTPVGNVSLSCSGNGFTVTVAGSSASGIRFGGEMDLSAYSELKFTVCNENKVSCLQMYIQLQDVPGTLPVRKQVQGAMNHHFMLYPGETRDISVKLPADLPHPEVYQALVGMRNTPYSIDEHYSYAVNLASVKALKICAFKASAGSSFIISDIRFVDGMKAQLAPWMKLDSAAFFPFVDRYGQFKYKDWPGKIHSDEELRAAREKEAADLAGHKGASDWSRYGGWKNGPKLEATGHFRVAKVNGKWWMVDPEGYLFWSHGVVRVTTSTGVTPLDGRKHFFEELPAEDSEFGTFYYTHDALLKPYYTARNIKETYDSSSSNAYRKYGKDYKSEFADVAHKRLRSWGLNTIANSSDKDICLMDRTPYTDRIEISAPVIDGTGGLWWQFMDPFNDKFAESVRSQLLARKNQLDDPWCLGFFVDNEIKWGDSRHLAKCTAVAPEDQKAKIAMAEWLKSKYADIDALNSAWGTSFASWDGFLANRKKVPAGADADLEAFNTQLIEAYFSVVRREFKAVAPDVLYLGCRFSGSNSEVLRIAAKYCDVLSYNIYWSDLKTFALPEGIDKPVMIGEFHFGAMDRGMFHPGLCYTRNQTERAEMYYRYVRSALEHPNLIGTHWHQFSDQACTGRFDGENFQVGFTDICDTPYYETVGKLREIGYDMYNIRSGASSVGNNSDKEAFVNAESLGVYGIFLPYEGHPFSRMDPEKYGLTGSLAAKARQSTGVYVAFSTDSKTLSARWKTSALKVVGTNTGANAQKGLDLYIKKDGRWVFAATAAPDMKGDCIHHERKMLSTMPDGVKECLLYLPLFDVVDSLEIGIDLNSTISALPNPFKRKIVFLGSSITHGSAASRAGMTYVARYGRDNGLYCINMGFSGQGKLQESFAHALADTDADAFVFDQFSNPSAKEIRERFDKFVDIIRESHPDTPLIFVQTIRREKRNFNQAADEYEAAKQAAGEEMVRARMKKDKNIWFIDSKGFLGNDSLGTADGTHPTDVGFSRILDKLTPRLNKILKR